LLLRLQRQLHFAAGGDDHGLGGALQADFGRLRQHVAALADVLEAGLGRVRQVLARQQQRGRPAVVLQRDRPGDRGFRRVAGTPDVQVRDQAQAGGVLDRLVGRAVLAQADGVVREHVDDAPLHQRRHADRVAAVVAEGQEGAAVRDVAAVQRDAVHDRGHAELAHAVVDVAADLAVRHLHVAGQVDAQRRRALGVGEVGAGEVGAAAQQLGQGGGERFQRQLRRLARGHGLGLGVRGDGGVDRHLREVARQLALHAAAEFGGQLRMRGGVGGEALVPLRLRSCRPWPWRPRLVDFLGHHERLVRPAQRRRA
jgi:hypothetical protein